MRGIFRTLIALVVLVNVVPETVVYYENDLVESPSLPGPQGGLYSFPPLMTPLSRRRCPLCDSSVYSYCSDKLFHDSCCCHNPNNPYDKLPFQCQYADCSFLHSNTCAEHKLITACCCTNLLL